MEASAPRDATAGHDQRHQASGERSGRLPQHRMLNNALKSIARTSSTGSESVPATSGSAAGGQPVAAQLLERKQRRNKRGGGRRGELRASGSTSGASELDTDKPGSEPAPEQENGGGAGAWAVPAAAHAGGNAEQLPWPVSAAHAPWGDSLPPMQHPVAHQQLFGQLTPSDTLLSSFEGRGGAVQRAGSLDVLSGAPSDPSPAPSGFLEALQGFAARRQELRRQQEALMHDAEALERDMQEWAMQVCAQLDRERAEAAAQRERAADAEKRMQQAEAAAAAAERARAEQAQAAAAQLAAAQQREAAAKEAAADVEAREAAHAAEVQELTARAAQADELRAVISRQNQELHDWRFKFGQLARFLQPPPGMSQPPGGQQQLEPPPLQFGSFPPQAPKMAPPPGMGYGMPFGAPMGGYVVTPPNPDAVRNERV